ncbi:hypothetical protein [Myxococcus sp. SDU36]|uniref:hypothetical protein n=1 Tax=Myxococcus sp. SDU36 TaxID=2831967 RepID=UPI0025437A3F|nr:hypothetical protein [Myxococcus sp. SDU36]WIG98558.1 hypothetical protein KGD87_14875 [Myxococcus sp. SDU36]
MTDRYLPPKKIPTSLWDSPQTLLRLPTQLTTAYATEIEARNLLDAAINNEPDTGPTGGISPQETELHFATRFSGSCGRTALAALDPKSELRDASDRIIGALSGGKVSMLDIPCGTGAGAAALLTTIATLREQDCIPCHPLEVRLLGGDNSPHALQIANSLWTRITPALRTQAITLHHELMKWDVKDEASTVDLLSKWLNKGHDSRLHFILAANFSGFLGTSSNLKNAQSQLNHIFQWAGTRAAQTIWIEPQTNIADSFLSELYANAIKRVRRLFTTSSENPLKPHAKSECTQQHPLTKPKRFNVRLSLMMLDHKERTP